MISWSTRADLLADLRDTELSTCKVCSAENHAHYLVEQNYFLLYGLPVFPTKRAIYRICSSCSFKSKLKKGSSRVLDDYTGNKIEEINATYPLKFKFRYFWGNLVFLAIFGVIGWFVFNFAIS